MENVRKYGNPPFHVAVLHGGPGAAGGMAPVAQELSKTFGVLEPLQTQDSIAGQIQELKEVLEQDGNSPVILIGWSWGAWLGYLFAAEYPKLIAKLILVGSGPFEEGYVQKLKDTRLGRMTDQEKMELDVLIEALRNPSTQEKNKLLAQFGKLYEKIDSYDPVVFLADHAEVNQDIYASVWKEAATLRKSGELLKRGECIKCPVVALHGAYDPHPYEGVVQPLSRTLDNFRWVVLEKCGHEPWIERQAKDEFFKLLMAEIASIVPAE